MTRLIGSLLLLALCTSTQAAGLIFEGGVHVGGDTLLTVQFTNGDEESIKAGELLSLAAGFHTELDDGSQLRFSAGYKLDAINADNGDITFERIPLDVLYLFRLTDKWLVGGGTTYHLSPSFDVNASTIGLLGSADLDNALGGLIAFDYLTQGRTSDDWFIGGRITLIDYKNRFGSVSGNSIGLVFGYLFE